MLRDVTVKEWMDALRSGKYAQATGGLRKNDGFCCLGVLCDLQDPEGWKEETWEEEDPEGNSIVVGTYRWNNLDNSETEDIDFPPEFGPLLEQLHGIDNDLWLGDHLAAMNDGGSSFDKIAKELEDLLERAKSKAGTSGLADQPEPV